MIKHEKLKALVALGVAAAIGSAALYESKGDEAQARAPSLGECAGSLAVQQIVDRDAVVEIIDCGDGRFQVGREFCDGNMHMRAQSEGSTWNFSTGTAFIIEDNKPYYFKWGPPSSPDSDDCLNDRFVDFEKQLHSLPIFPDADPDLGLDKYYLLDPKYGLLFDPGY